VHGKQRRSHIDHVHAVGRQEERNSAAVLIHLATRHLPRNLSRIEHAAQPAHVLHMRIVRAVFAA
jgi:hypothetical protein